MWASVHFPDAVSAVKALDAMIGERAYKFYLDHLNNEGNAGSLHSRSR